MTVPALAAAEPARAAAARSACSASPSALAHRQRRAVRASSPSSASAPSTARRTPPPPRSPTWSSRDRLPDPIPVTGNQIVQVVDSRDRVVSASVNGDRLTALLLPRRGAPRRSTGRRLEVPGLAGRAATRRCASLAVRAGTGRRPQHGRGGAAVRRHRAQPAHPQGSRCWSTYPLLLAVLALIAWRVIGAALRPVEVAAVVRGADLRERAQDDRLPVPDVARRDPRARGHPELHARPARGRPRPAASVRRRRRPRAAQPAGLDADPARGRRAARRGHGGDRRPARRGAAGWPALVEDLLVLARLDADDAPAAPVRAGRPVVACWSTASSAGTTARGCRSASSAASPTARRARAARGPAAGRSSTWSTTPCATPRTQVEVAVRREGADVVVEVCRRRRGHPGGRPRAGLRAVHPARRRPRPRRRRQRARAGHRPRAGGGPRRRRAADGVGARRAVRAAGASERVSGAHVIQGGDHRCRVEPGP